MNPSLTLRTDRLELRATTLEHIQAELSDPASLGSLLGASVPASWPPGEYDRDALEFFRSKLAQTPDAVGWYGWYVILLGPDDMRRILVAGAGFLGPPSPDGVVELGYSVVPEARGRGYASEAVLALVDHAFREPTVVGIIAHTDDSNLASSAVLIHCGFKRVGSGQTQGSSRYELGRSTAP
jgi:ribosomal-protein-alanine N-acetyltransferase